MTIKAGNIRKGMYILFKNQPHLVTKTDFMSPGKGSAFMRCKLKGVQSGATQEFTFKSTESVEQVDVTSVKMQFLYRDGSDFVFMDNQSFEQATIPESLVGEQGVLLTPDVSVYIVQYEDKPIGVSFPDKIKLKVTEAVDADSGNTVGQAKKTVTLETGYEIQVPVFIKQGETIIVDTNTLSYFSRAN